MSAGAMARLASARPVRAPTHSAASATVARREWTALVVAPASPDGPVVSAVVAAASAEVVVGSAAADVVSRVSKKENGRTR